MEKIKQMYAISRKKIRVSLVASTLISAKLACASCDPGMGKKIEKAQNMWIEDTTEKNGLSGPFIRLKAVCIFNHLVETDGDEGTSVGPSTPSFSWSKRWFE